MQYIEQFRKVMGKTIKLFKRSLKNDLAYFNTNLFF